MKLIKYIAGLGLLLLAACTSEPIPFTSMAQDEFAYIDGDKVIVNMSVDMPDMQSVSSRALTGTPDYTDMHLYLVEFDDNGGPLVNTLKTIYTPEEETPESDRIIYKVCLLYQSPSPRDAHEYRMPASA